MILANINQNKTNVPKYRSINKCLEELKKIDEETAISPWCIRQLCKQNKIKYFNSGNKSLVDYTELLDYLGYSGA